MIKLDKIAELVLDEVDRHYQEVGLKYWDYHDEERMNETFRSDSDFCSRLVIRDHMRDFLIQNSQYPFGRVDYNVGFEGAGYIRDSIEKKPERAKILKDFQW